MMIALHCVLSSGRSSGAAAAGDWSRRHGAAAAAGPVRPCKHRGWGGPSARVAQRQGELVSPICRYRHVGHALDANTWSVIDKLIDKLTYAKVGVLVNNAGMNDTSWDQDCWNKIMAVNFTGAISLAEQILPVLADGAPACTWRTTFIALPLHTHDLEPGLKAHVCSEMLCGMHSSRVPARRRPHCQRHQRAGSAVRPPQRRISPPNRGR